MGKITKKWLSWVLVAAVAVAGAGFPAAVKTSQAEQTSVSLSVQSGTSPLQVEKNEYAAEGKEEYIGDVMFNIPSQAADKAAINSNGVKSIEVSVTVSQITSGSDKASVMLYVQPGEDGDWQWNQSEAAEAVSGQSYTLTYDFSGMDWNGGSTMGHIGLRFANCAQGSSVYYTIDSAKLIMESSSSGSSSAGSSSSENTLTGVTAVINEVSVGDSWAEYNYTLTNGTASAVPAVMIKIPVQSGSVTSLQSWGCTVSYNEGYIVISHTTELAAGGTYTCSSGTKFGFSGGAVLGTPEVYEYNVFSATGLQYELTGETKDLAYADTPFGKHGKLSLKEVDGYSAPVIVDKDEKPFQLRGASTHGMHWEEDGGSYVNKGAFQSLRDEWGVNLVRLVSYVTQGGYTEGSQAVLDSKIETGVQAATELGMYVIIDWHVHQENPHDKKTEAKAFFEKYANKYKDYENVIFEICNEPTGIQWYTGGDDLYSYCKEVAEVIRGQGSDALIICGTNTWSQDVEEVAAKPLKNDGFENILYTLHFYSGSHYSDIMDKAKTALAAGTPIFVTEFGICDASGNGNFDTVNADAWISLCDANNISYACWSLSNKAESASYLDSSCTKKNGGWVASDLAKTGIWLVNTYRAHQDAENGTDTSIGDTGGSSGNTGGTGDSGNTGSGGNTGGTGGSGNTGGTGDSGNTGSSGNTGGTGDSGNTGGTGNTGSAGDTGSTENGGSTGGDISDTGGTGGGKTDTVSVKKVTIKKVKGAKKKLTVTWKKVQGASGYQVSVSLKKSFAKAKTVKVKSGKKTKAVVKKLKSKKKYYVRVRAFSKADGKTVYGAWSKAKSKKVK